MGTISTSTAYRQLDNATESSSGQATSSMLLGANFHGCTVHMHASPTAATDYIPPVTASSTNFPAETTTAVEPVPQLAQDDPKDANEIIPPTTENTQESDSSSEDSSPDSQDEGYFNLSQIKPKKRFSQEVRNLPPKRISKKKAH